MNVGNEKKRRSRAGNGEFSLMELLVVLAIIFILIAVMLPNLTNLNAAFQLDGTARGLISLIQRAHFDALGDTTGYRIVLYDSNAGTNANSYKRQRQVPDPPFQLTSSNNWTDMGDPIQLPRDINLATTAPQVSGLSVISFDSAGDVLDENGAYIGTAITITLTNQVGNSKVVSVSGTSYVQIQ